MTEAQGIRELAPRPSLADQVREVFDRKASAGDRKLILATYEQKLNDLIMNLPKDKQENVAIKIQQILTTTRGVFAEYGARITDFVRKITLWPLMNADTNFPKDKYYQIELARAKAWGEFAQDTKKTATAERTAYRDHFLSTAIAGANVGGVTIGLGGAIVGGSIEGAKIGTVVGGGLQGAIGGAMIGGIIGGAYSWGLYIKDKIMGPPAVFYDLFLGNGRSRITTGISNTITPPASPIGSWA